MMLTYHLTAEQSATWLLGGQAQARLEETILDQLDEADCEEHVVVTLDTGEVLYTIERWQV
jgi:hypothetical protein